MTYRVHKQTYGEGRAYRYQIADESDTVRFIIEPTGVSLPIPTQSVAVLDEDGQPVGRIEPSPVSPWRWVREYTLLMGEEEEPRATIEEQWSLVDRILLRLPHYTIRIDDQTFTAHGNRYGERFYQLFRPPAGDEEAEAEEELEEESDREEEIAGLPADDTSRWGEPVGDITRPPSGASYVVEVTEPVLFQAPLVLSALAIVIDLHLQGQ